MQELPIWPINEARRGTAPSLRRQLPFYIFMVAARLATGADLASSCQRRHGWQMPPPPPPPPAALRPFSDDASLGRALCARCPRVQPNWRTVDAERARYWLIWLLGGVIGRVRLAWTQCRGAANEENLSC